MTLDCPGIWIVRVWIKREPPVKGNPPSRDPSTFRHPALNRTPMGEYEMNSQNAQRLGARAQLAGVHKTTEVRRNFVVIH